MREILFRAKRKDNAEWVYGDLRQYKNSPFIKEDFYTIDTMQTTNDLGENHTVICETIGEYTGLTDKNNSKIFEGDIVSLGNLDAIKICGCYVVKWDNEQCRFSMYLNGKYEQAGFNKDTMKSYQIIGNIYENEELINVNMS